MPGKWWAPVAPSLSAPLCALWKCSWRLVAAEPFVLRAVHRRVVVDPGEDRLAIAPLDQERRQASLHERARAVAPHAVRVLVGEIRVELGAGRALAPRRYVADLGKELLPALMGKELGGRAALHRAPVGDRVAERVQGRVAHKGAEVVVVGQPPGVALTGKPATENGIDLGASRKRVMGIGVCSCSRGMRWVNLAAPNSGLRGVPVGTSAKALRANGLSPFLNASSSAGREDAPPEEVAPGDLAYRSALLTISARLSRAFWASLCRMREALLEMYIGYPSL